MSHRESKLLKRAYMASRTIVHPGAETSAARGTYGDGPMARYYGEDKGNG